MGQTLCLSVVTASLRPSVSLFFPKFRPLFSPAPSFCFYHLVLDSVLAIPPVAVISSLNYSILPLPLPPFHLPHLPNNSSHLSSVCPPSVSPLNLQVVLPPLPPLHFPPLSSFLPSLSPITDPIKHGEGHSRRRVTEVRREKRRRGRTGTDYRESLRVSS